MTTDREDIIDEIAKAAAREIYERDDFRIMSPLLGLEAAARFAVKKALGEGIEAQNSIAGRCDISPRGNAEPTWGTARGYFTGDAGLLSARGHSPEETEQILTDIAARSQEVIEAERRQ